MYLYSCENEINYHVSNTKQILACGKCSISVSSYFYNYLHITEHRLSE